MKLSLFKFARFVKNNLFLEIFRQRCNFAIALFPRPWCQQQCGELDCVHHVSHRNASVDRVHGAHPRCLRSSAWTEEFARKVSHVSRRLSTDGLPLPLHRPAGHKHPPWVAMLLPSWVPFFPNLHLRWYVVFSACNQNWCYIFYKYSIFKFWWKRAY